MKNKLKSAVIGLPVFVIIVALLVAFHFVISDAVGEDPLTLIAVFKVFSVAFVFGVAILVAAVVLIYSLVFCVAIGEKIRSWWSK